jgi:DNA-directed RNA polymerase specialized sigma subunit
VTDLATFELARPNRADDELDVLVSDGCAVLVPALVKLAQLPAANALAFAARIIRQGFWKGRRERAWSGGNSREREKVIRRFRTAFVRERGEAPTAEQVREHLATLFTNPQMPVVTRRRMVPFSELESDPDRASLIDQVPDPHRTIDTRAIKAAMRLFKGDDRKMFRMAIDGANLRDIAATVGISKGAAFSSVNGLLWRARCDRRLASELGVVADTTPLRDPKHGWISVRNRPPAALAG